MKKTKAPIANLDIKDVIGDHDLNTIFEEQIVTPAHEHTEIVTPEITHYEEPMEEETIVESLDEMEVDESENLFRMFPFPRNIVNEGGSLLEGIELVYSPIFKNLSEAIIMVSQNDAECIEFMRGQLIGALKQINEAFPIPLTSQEEQILEEDISHGELNDFI